MIFAIFSDPDRIWILLKVFVSRLDYQISISAQRTTLVAEVSGY